MKKFAYIFVVSLLLTACATQPINTQLSGGTGVGLGYGITENPQLR